MYRGKKRKEKGDARRKEKVGEGREEGYVRR